MLQRFFKIHIVGRRIQYGTLTFLFLWVLQLGASAAGLNTILLDTRIPVFSIKDKGKQVGYFTPGSELLLLKKEGMYIRVRFTSKSGRIIEAYCRPNDLGPAGDIFARGPLKPDSSKVSRSENDSENPSANDLVRDNLLKIFYWQKTSLEGMDILYKNPMIGRDFEKLVEFTIESISKDTQQKLRSKKTLSVYLIEDDDLWNKICETFPQPVDPIEITISDRETIYFHIEKSVRSASLDIIETVAMHAILQLFKDTQTPAWFMHGLAGWYAKTLTSDFYGIKNSYRKLFPPIETTISIKPILGAKYAPKDANLLKLYNQTTTYMMAMIREDPNALHFYSMMRAYANGGGPWTVIQAEFTYANMQIFVDDFQKFAGYSRLHDVKLDERLQIVPTM